MPLGLRLPSGVRGDWGLDSVPDDMDESLAMAVIPSFPSQLEWKIGLAWANTRGSLNSPS